VLKGWEFWNVDKQGFTVVLFAACATGTCSQLSFLLNSFLLNAIKLGLGINGNDGHILKQGQVNYQ